MTEPNQPVMRVCDWDQLYENNRSRDLARTTWFPAPNDLGADWYAELVSDADGAAHLGVWHSLLMVASKAKPRGALVRGDGQAHTAESLARVTRLSEPLVKAASERLLKIGLLEMSGNKRRKKNGLGSHTPAAKSHSGAGNSQKGAVERKGTEHHQQEEKRKDRPRTEPDGTEGVSEESTTECSDAQSGVGTTDLPKKGDDEGAPPPTSYASSEDELKAIFQSKTGEPMTIDVLSSIRSNLELRLVSMDDFVLEVRKHAKNDWRNPPGFLRDLSKRFRAKTRPASAPVTAAEAEEKNYRCPHCSSRVRGEGAILDANGNPAPCSCASPEYIARQRERGVFAMETPQ